MWTNTLQQIADGLTKPSAKQKLVEVLRRGYHALRFDPSFTAGRKLAQKAVNKARQELEDASARDRESREDEVHVSEDVRPARVSFPSARAQQINLGMQSNEQVARLLKSM